MENILGTKLADRYLIEELVGVGGMCNVYRAFDAEALRTVAVKMLRDEYAADEEYLRRFRNESRAINALSHPNIVKIYDVVLDVPNPYLVMEYVSGITLKEYVERKKPIPGKTAANIAGLVLTALQCAHENGIVHRDVKPQNIMVTERPIDGHSKKLICRNIELLLDYCMRFYDRQFITRKAANRDVLTKFEEELDNYFFGNTAAANGLPSVKYFAERCFLSPNYFGDLIKKETGRTPQEYIQAKIINMAKEELLGTTKTVNEISYGLGFQYSQHFNRYFKRSTGMTPNEYRKANA